MAKTRSSSKTDIVREYLKGNPKASAGQIVNDLKSHGISRALAAKVKSRYGKKSGSTKPQPTAPAASAATGTKADAIRDVVRTMKKPIRPRDVRAILAEKGIDASTTMIGQVLNRMGLRRKRRRKAAAGVAAPAVASNSAGLSINDLVAAKKLVGEIGSIEKVRETLTALARLG